jgi:hypothetical protein
MFAEKYESRINADLIEVQHKYGIDATEALRRSRDEPDAAGHE